MRGRKVALQQRERLSEGVATEVADGVVASLSAVRTINGSTQQLLQCVQRLGIAGVQADRQGRLAAVPAERALTDDEAHGVAEREGVHGRVGAGSQRAAS